MNRVFYAINTLGVSSPGCHAGRGIQCNPEVNELSETEWGYLAVIQRCLGAITKILGFSGSLRVFVALEPCDMRKGFNGLVALVVDKLRECVKEGALFWFTNKRRNRLKVLYWDGSGLWVLCKRLKKGRFSWPKSTDPSAVKLKLRPEAFTLLCDGVQMQGVEFLPWYERET